MVKEQPGQHSCWRCWMEDQAPVPSEVRIMPGEGDLCAEHAAELALQLLALPTVQAALADRKTAVLVLDDEHDEVQAMSVLARPMQSPIKSVNRLRDRLNQWTTERLTAIHSGCGCAECDPENP